MHVPWQGRRIRHISAEVDVVLRPACLATPNQSFVIANSARLCAIILFHERCRLGRVGREASSVSFPANFTVATYTAQDVARIFADPSMIRHQRKID
jgi:hypothetical protein